MGNEQIAPVNGVVFTSEQLTYSAKHCFESTGIQVPVLERAMPFGQWQPMVGRSVATMHGFPKSAQDSVHAGPPFMNISPFGQYGELASLQRLFNRQSHGAALKKEKNRHFLDELKESNG